jgi:hypothetical protein
VQAYRNQKDSFVADGAAKQTYLFYGPMMMGMNAYGTTQAIGANCVFRAPRSTPSAAMRRGWLRTCTRRCSSLQRDGARYTCPKS